jgi:hypothetical protein
MTSENNNVQEETFKTQLDKAADNTRELENQKPNPIVEKSKFFKGYSTDRPRLTFAQSQNMSLQLPRSCLLAKAHPKRKTSPQDPPSDRIMIIRLRIL